MRAGLPVFMTGFAFLVLLSDRKVDDFAERVMGKPQKVSRF